MITTQASQKRLGIRSIGQVPTSVHALQELLSAMKARAEGPNEAKGRIVSATVRMKEDASLMYESGVEATSRLHALPRARCIAAEMTLVENRGPRRKCARLGDVCMTRRHLGSDQAVESVAKQAPST